jgi:hypothetical protein
MIPGHEGAAYSNGTVKLTSVLVYGLCVGGALTWVEFLSAIQERKFFGKVRGWEGEAFPSWKDGGLHLGISGWISVH